MRYAIYSRNVKGEFNTFNVESAKERDIMLDSYKKESHNMLAVCYCPIYSCGEYGQLTPVIGNALDAL